MTARYVVIMAGGSGTRFWPKSRGSFPKQFLAIGGSTSLLRQTADRVLPVVGAERLLVVTAASHATHARDALPELPPENLLIEPEGRNTAPCIGWASKVIARRDPLARVAVLPADHYIADVPGFVAHLESALEAAEERIVLFGIVPTHPETGYGYIKRGAALAQAGRQELCRVERFVEKPDRATAERYLAERTYLWNSGMFVFPAALMLEEIKRLLPLVDAGLEAVLRGPEDLAKVYPGIPSISIDYGVMEKSARIAVMPASFGWSDVGSWDAAMEIRAADEHGNVSDGDALLLDVRRSMVDAGGGRFVAVVGVEDLVVVDTKDALLVIRRGDSQRVKNVVEALKAQGRKGLL